MLANRRPSARETAERPCDSREGYSSVYVPMSGGVMQPSPQRRKAVIYLTILMTFAVRALSLFLTVWLTAATALPLCCWSMSSAHAHQQAADSAASDATPAPHHHEHHGGGDSETGTDPASVVSAVPAHDCDAAFADAATTTGIVKRAALRPAPADSYVSILPHASGHDVARSDTSPPGSSFTSSFLSPLRI